MNKNLIMLLIVTAVAVTSCLPSPTPNPSATLQPQVPTQTLAPFKMVTPMPSATLTVLLPTLEKKCISYLPSRPGDIEIEGIPVFLDTQAPIVVLMNKNEVRIPQNYKGNNGTVDQSISPDDKFLVYRQIINGNIGNDVVVTSNGTIIKEFAKEFVGYLTGGDWISGKYIRYLAKSETGSNQTKILAMNVETGEVQQLREDFPDMADSAQTNWGIDNGATYYRSEKGTEVIYDLFLNRVVYPKQDSFLSLYDVQKDTELATIKLTKYSDPKWSPNGETFSFKGIDPVTLAQDIYIVSRDGDQFIPLTYLTKLYPKANFGSYSWSLDGQQIALWAKIDEHASDDSLFISDISTMKVMDVCITGLGSWGSIVSAGLANIGIGHEQSKSFSLAGQPVWSPDGKKILIARYDVNTQSVNDILVDLENKIAYPIATDLEPMGWLK